MEMTLFILSTIIVIALYVIVLLKVHPVSRGKKLKQKAIREGHTVKARLVDSKDISVGFYETRVEGDTSSPRAQHKAVYEYVVGGKKYIYKTIVEISPHEEITLYFPDGNPEKVFAEGDEPRDAKDFSGLIFVCIGIQIVYRILEILVRLSQLLLWSY